MEFKFLVLSFLKITAFCLYCLQFKYRILSIVPLYLPFSVQQCVCFVFVFNYISFGSKILYWYQSLVSFCCLMGSFRTKTWVLQLRKLLLLENFLTSLFWSSFQNYSVSCWVFALSFSFLILLYWGVTFRSLMFIIPLPFF